MSNFDYIKGNPKTGNLYDFCVNAESFASTYPEISVTEARKANELCIRMVFETATGLSPDGLSTFEMLDTPEYVSYFAGTDLVDCMHQVRKVGNKAAHGEVITTQQALDVIEKLHRIVGEICYLLYIVDDYPAFDTAKLSQSDVSNYQKDEEIIINSEYLDHLRLMKKFSTSAIRKPKKYENIHIESKKADVKIDSAANNRLAFEKIYSFLSAHLPNYELLPDYSGQKIKIIHASKMKTVAIKSGCSVLGKRTTDGTTSILPGVDLILYTPCVEDADIIHQFHVFSCEEFYALWEKLGLIRLKVSSAVNKLLKEAPKSSTQKQIEQYADTISIQSFTNSGRKKVLVVSAMNSYPLLGDEGINRIELLFENDG